MAFEKLRRGFAYKTSRRHLWRLKMFYTVVTSLEVLHIVFLAVMRRMLEGNCSGNTLEDTKRESLSCKWDTSMRACKEDSSIFGWFRYDHSCAGEFVVMYCLLATALVTLVGMRSVIVLVITFCVSYYASLPEENMRKILKYKKTLSVRIGHVVTRIALSVGPTLQWYLFVACVVILIWLKVLLAMGVCEPSSKDSFQCNYNFNAKTHGEMSQGVKHGNVTTHCSYNRVKNCYYLLANDPSREESSSACNTEDPLIKEGNLDIRQCTSFCSVSTENVDDKNMELNDVDKLRCLRVAALNALIDNKKLATVDGEDCKIDVNKHCKITVAGVPKMYHIETDADPSTCNAIAREKATKKWIWEDEADVCSESDTWLSPKIVAFTSECELSPSDLYFDQALLQSFSTILLSIELLLGTITRQCTQVEPFLLRALPKGTRANRGFAGIVYRFLRSAMP